MKTKILTLIIFLIIGSETYSQPILKSIGGNEHDFGKIGQSEQHCIMQLINTGTDTLVINDVKPSCGCTTAPVDRRRLTRGDTANLFIMVNYKKTSGDKSTKINIITNSPDSVFSITLKAEVVQEIKVSPETFPMPEDVIIGRAISTSINLENKGEEPITVLKPVIEAQGLEWVISPAGETIVRPKEKIVLTASLVSKEEGMIVGKMIIPTTSKFDPVIEVPVFVNARKENSPRAGK